MCMSFFKLVMLSQVIPTLFSNYNVGVWAGSFDELPDIAQDKIIQGIPIHDKNTIRNAHETSQGFHKVLKRNNRGVLNVAGSIAKPVGDSECSKIVASTQRMHQVIQLVVEYGAIQGCKLSPANYPNLKELTVVIKHEQLDGADAISTFWFHLYEKFPLLTKLELVKGLDNSPLLLLRSYSPELDRIPGMRQRNQEIIRKLTGMINSGKIDLGSNYGGTLLLRLMELKIYDLAELLVSKGVNVNQPEMTIRSLRETPFSFAIKKETPLKMIQLFLENGADPNQFDREGGSPMEKAASRGNAQLMQLLIDHGGDVNLKNNVGWTPLVFATLTGNNEVQNVLLANGANKSDLDKLLKSLGR